MTFIAKSETNSFVSDENSSDAIFSRTNSINESRDSESNSIRRLTDEIGLQSLNSNETSNMSSPVLEQNKSKHGFRGFLRRFLRSTSSQTKPIKKQSKSESNLSIIRSKSLRLIVIRHGERLDRFYSSHWLRQAFDQQGNYCRFSPILPETLPVRQSIHDFDLDPPLTHKGLKDAYNTGVALKDKHLDIHFCYSSPSLRCIQTAWKILEGLQSQNHIKIRVEPGLFECTGWYTNDVVSPPLFTMPRFMTKNELIENKYPIDKSYREHMNLLEVSQIENELEFYQRSYAVTAAILQNHEKEYTNATSPVDLHILFVAHAPSLETCTRQISGGQVRPHSLSHVIRHVDFLTMTVIERTTDENNRWIFRRNSFYGDI